ncbi:N-isopropylammelide isopropyl amidohydrolase [Streptomyces sp. RB5]|uniref:N-isopropylammelide isopropyl amidohydrolase n=1 Tax=Streptomyces smaragdinus TaxID=2585196 RepID=A0A7K0CAD2_9ACTN|nr:amidohydrolase [Streptomyces smaragdinus]MQY10378.1 N-isopropylammelide isopropyl amidohydrolase [Streptomyces smaragdinus]
MGAMLLRGGRVRGRDGRSDILVRDGVIRAIGPEVTAGDAEVVDVRGLLVLPGLVEAHCHLDKTLYGGPWVPHTAGDALADRIGTERRRRAGLGVPDTGRITALLETMIAAGTSYVRTHTDVSPEFGLAGVEAVRAAAEAVAGRIDVAQVAFPQYGLLTNPGTAALLEEALQSGVGTIGGIDPAGFDRDPVRHLDVVFGLAERYGAGVDIHLHDGGTLGVWQLELIAERARVTGLSGKVAVSHAYALGQADPATQTRIAGLLAEAGVAVVTAAVYDFPVPPVKTLRAAGVTVACGHDGIRDLWGPYGSGDMLERAMHLAYRSTFRRDDDIELALHAATYGGAALLGLEAYGLVPGAPADLVLVDAGSFAEAVVTRPPREIVLKAGKRVAGRAGAADARAHD